MAPTPIAPRRDGPSPYGTDAAPPTIPAPDEGWEGLT